MRNKKDLISKLIAVLVIIAVLTTMTFVAVADFGDFSGDRDYGDSDSGSGCGGDSDDDWDYGDSDSGSGCNINLSEGSTASPVITVIIIVFMICIAVGVVRAVIQNRKNKNKPDGDRSQPVIPRSSGTEVQSLAVPLQSIKEYTARDPEFNSAALIAQISNLYVQLQNCITARDLTPVRPYFTSEMYEQYAKQLDEQYTQQNKTNHIERVAVLGVLLEGWRTNGDNDEIVAAVSSRVVNYVTDDTSGKVIKGSSTAEVFGRDKWLLTRPTGVKTVSHSGQTTSFTCPYCGAPMDLSKSAKCEFCDSVVASDLTGWVISAIDL